ncbi:LLM class F420-dependent oxidoreductase [Nocardia xishanensis]
MKLGLSLDYWAGGPPPGLHELVATAENLGYDSVWTSEAYGSDAVSPLAWLGSRTTRLELGTAIMQMSARTPTATAMAAMTMDHLSQGRFVLGLGVSGPQVVEGWYGQEFAKPLARTREYIEIVRRTIARDVVEFNGDHFNLPATYSGLGKPLRSTIYPKRSGIPIYLAAEGPKNVALAAEIADGWFPLFYSPFDDCEYRAALEEGFARPTARHTADNFEIACQVTVDIDDDLDAAINRVRHGIALYIGGMGTREANFHSNVFARMGYEGVCADVANLYLAGKKTEAASRIPDSLIQKVALVGPAAKIAEELPIWKNSLLTSMLINGDPRSLRIMADLAN